MKLNRNIAPEFREIEKIEIPKVESQTLPNGTKIHVIEGGSQDIVKLDWVYKAGLYYQDKPVVASMTNAMLSEGTKSYKSAQLAEIFDFHGAYSHNSFSHHYGQISLFSLNKHITKLLPVIEEMIKMPSIPEKELDVIRKNKKNSFLLSFEKTSSLAHKQFLKVLFGDKHSYSNILKKEDFDDFTRDDLLNFYKQYYTPANCEIIISGKVTDEMLKQVEDLFGNYGTDLPAAGKKEYSIISDEQKEHHVTKTDSVQSTIKIGRTIINKNHEEYNQLKVLNVILGGYFGSRLMSNIREEKGYTYGIYSTLSSLPDSGYFGISTDVGNQVREEALKEIYIEIEKLQQELVPEEELKIVQNYLTGELLRTFDGPFSIAEVVRADLPYNFGLNYYQKFLEDIKSITPERLQVLANKYLNPEDLYEIVAGI